jgi:serine/threonine-protein kinase
MRLAAGLDHPRIVPIVEMGQAGRDLWIASDYIEGVDARQLAHQRGGTLSLGDAVAITCQLLEALEHAHQQNLVHRDVKPPNILVTGQPGAYEAYLSDFGLIRNVDEAGLSDITGPREARGTVPFMPPEQVLDCRFVKAAGDIYSTGATLYWLLAGQFVRDFEACDRRGERIDPYIVLLEHKVNLHGPGLPPIPEAVIRVLEKALAQEPEDRYETAAAMARALRTALTASSPTP